MNLSIQADFTQLTKNLSRVQRQQVPFAIAETLNALAADVANAITAQMDQRLEKPTPFTKKAFLAPKGFNGKKAKKTNFEAIVESKEIQAEYLKFQIAGGTRLPNQKAILVPTRFATKNQYGNWPRPNRKRAIEGKGDFFTAGSREGKTPGIYKQVGNRLQPFAIYVDQADYKARLPIDKIANGVVANRLQKQFSKALQRAMATAK
jgi:hypothetical protein